MTRKIKINAAFLRVAAVLFVGVLLALLLFKLLTPDTSSPARLTVTEDSELRTGAAAFYPPIFSVKSGDRFSIMDHQGKWYYVKDKQNRKGWIAGWHTSLNIEPDKTILKNPFKGKKIIIDPGHGGSDQGASSKSGTLEKNVTLKTGLMLKKKLEAAGAEVVMTRSTDKYVKLKDRQGAADAFISIHSDALAESTPNGLTVYYYQDSQKPLADTLHMAIRKKSLLSDRGVRQENFQVIRQTKIPAVLLELGYISNPLDEQMMKDDVQRQIVTTGIVDGLRNYFLY